MDDHGRIMDDPHGIIREFLIITDKFMDEGNCFPKIYPLF